MKARIKFLTSILLGMGLLTGPALAAAQDADPDWPCVQRLVPEVAGGMIWAGPPLDDVDEAALDQGAMALAGELAARRVPIEEAERHVEGYAASLEAGDKAEHLTGLFKTTLDIINDDRESIINGIKKFSHGQRTLAEKITAKNQELEAIERSEILKRDTLTAERDWDIRIFEDRRQSLTYLCEQPVLLEQRAFALARTIAGHLDQ